MPSVNHWRSMSAFVTGDRVLKYWQILAILNHLSRNSTPASDDQAPVRFTYRGTQPQHLMTKNRLESDDQDPVTPASDDQEPVRIESRLGSVNFKDFSRSAASHDNRVSWEIMRNTSSASREKTRGPPDESRTSNLFSFPCKAFFFFLLLSPVFKSVLNKEASVCERVIQPHRV